MLHAPLEQFLGTLEHIDRIDTGLVLGLLGHFGHALLDRRQLHQLMASRSSRSFAESSPDSGLCLVEIFYQLAAEQLALWRPLKGFVFSDHDYKKAIQSPLSK